MPARQRKKAVPAYKRGREFKVILPPDISERIEREALEEGRPQSRIIINHLSRIPYLEMQRGFDETLGDMKAVLARYGARAAMGELSEAIKRALDEAAAAPTAAQREACFDSLLVLHRALAKHERGVAQAERDEQTAAIVLLEKQLAAIEALPAADPRRDELPGRRRTIEDLKRGAAGGEPQARNAPQLK